jgi:hypothetical protein
MIHWQTLLADSKDNQKIIHAADSDPSAAWNLWIERRRLRLESLRRPYQAALHWAYASPETKTLFEQRDSFLEQRDSFNAAKKSSYLLFGDREYDAISTLEFAASLPEQTASLDPSQWAEQFLSLVTNITKFAAGELPLEKRPLLHQLYCAELPWLIGCLFPDLEAGGRLLQTARDNFRLGLTETLDGAGLPNASDYFLLRPLLACWTRTLVLGKQAKLRPYPPNVHRQFEWAALHTLRFMRKNGSPIFSGATPQEMASLIAMLQYALAFDSDENDHAVARTLFPQKFSICKIARTRLSLMQYPSTKSMPKPTTKSATTPKEKPTKTKASKTKASIKTPVKASDSESAYFSEWAQLAMLRAGWGFQKPSLAVAYAPFLNALPHADNATNHASQNVWTDENVATELNLAEKTIWSGVWNAAVRLDGRLLLPIDSWSMTCEISNEYANYLEIEMPLTENMRLQRHMLLCHKEKLLLMADSVLPAFEDDVNEGEEYDGFDDPQYAIRYESRLPLADGMDVKTVTDAMELTLVFEQTPVARVFPLALPEWKDPPQPSGGVSDKSISGELFLETNAAGTDGLPSVERSLAFRQEAFGRAVFAPLLFDLNAKRFQEPYTWRQLTVGENLERVARDRAAAFRMQIGKLQVLFYRTLTSPLNRTFFGHNLVGDFFAGRFNPKTGQVTTLAEAEPEY